MKSQRTFSLQAARVCFASLALIFAANAADAQQVDWQIPMVGVGQASVDPVASVRANRAQRKLYVGTLSRDEQRTGLWVYDLGDEGQPQGMPRKYSDHPDALPADHHSTVVCLLHDVQHRKLFLGVRGSHPTHARGLVMYSLNERGEPTGAPEAFDHGNPHKACDAMVLHPKNGRLYAVGWGGEGVYIVDRDEQGRPIGKPTFHKLGGYGGSDVAIRSDGSKIYRGSYPSVIEVSDLDPQGELTGQFRSIAIPDGPKEYARFAATDRAIYFQAPDKRLAWFACDAAGELQSTMQSAEIPELQAVAVADTRDQLLLAVASSFEDAITRKKVTNGVELRQVTLNADGSPGATVRRSPVQLRASAMQLHGGAEAALGAKSLGRDFLGNRVSGMHVRFTLLSLEAAETPLPAVNSIALGDAPGYLRFATSTQHARVYGIVDGQLVTKSIAAMAKEGEASAADEGNGVRGAKSEYADVITLDAARQRLIVAKRDGSLAIYKLDAQGRPVDVPQVLVTSLASVGAVVVHPKTGDVFAIGAPGGPAPAENGVVVIPAGSHITDAVLDSDRGRIYLTGAYRGRENTGVVTLDPTGRPKDPMPRWYADGIPVDNPQLRTLMSRVRLDAVKRKLYLVGAQENPTTQPGYLIVRDLDEQGDPMGDPRPYPSSNTRGSCLALDLSSDGGWLYESGWGDPTIFVRRLDEQGEPSRDAIQWSCGSQGKQQLAFVSLPSVPPADGSSTTAKANRQYLLIGTHPSLLEVIRLRTPSQPEPGAMAELTVESMQQKLGMMRSGQTSPWVNLDTALKNGIGPAIARVTLQGAAVKRASLRWEVALSENPGSNAKSEPIASQDASLKVIRSIDMQLVGNVGAIILPKYGLDDPSQLKSLVRTSAEEFARYRHYAEKYAVTASDRPKQTLVANGLIGIDSCESALEDGMATLALLGHNTAQIWNWPGVDAKTIRAVADRHGIRRFREAIYNPPAYFHFETDLVRPESLDRWSAGFRDAAARMGAKSGELALMHIGDEPGWYFPKVTEEVANDPKRLAVFRTYLQSKGLSPADVGAASWESVFPGRRSEAKSLAQRRLFFWTTRFFAESLSYAFAAATESLQREINPSLLTTMNLNNWPGRFYIPSPGAKLANNSNDGPDAGMGMPDWFDLGRKRAVSCIWTEDWFGDADAQLWSLYGDLLRCAAREGDRASRKTADGTNAVVDQSPQRSPIEYGGYPVGQSTGAMVDGMKFKIAALIGHGAKAIDPYIFGPHLAFADGWSEKEVSYRNLADAMRLVGKSERLVAPGRPRDGTVAIVFPQASQVWDADSKFPAYQQEIYGLHAALTHANYPVDFIDDFGLEAGDLARRKYATVYLTAPNLSLAAQQALLEWTQAGGTLVLYPGAAAADQYNEPASLLRDHSGVQTADVPRIAPPHHTQAYRIARSEITIQDPAARNATIGVARTYAITQTVALAPNQVNAGDVEPIAKFADGSVAVTIRSVGRGRIVSLGFWPGVSYWLSPDRTDATRLPQGWSTEIRAFATWPARLANAPRHVVVDVPGVEACLLESNQGRAVTLLNWTGQPLPRIRVSFPDLRPDAKVVSAQRGAIARGAGEATLELPLDTADVLMIE